MAQLEAAFGGDENIHRQYLQIPEIYTVTVKNVQGVLFCLKKSTNWSTCKHDVFVLACTSRNIVITLQSAFAAV